MGMGLTLKKLDLDFLEDPHSRRRSRASTPLKEFSPDSVDLVKILLLGAPCVGKTSIIQTAFSTALHSCQNQYGGQWRRFQAAPVKNPYYWSFPPGPSRETKSPHLIATP
ncbi:hypothetical protein RUM44_009486 [Polyplax serrata]|uniref:Uncharacterized protein n=1 Tax=Polyplax serrata TaxID=468196 RepID=A0ABR1ASV1_POLSC